jgi:hypothetical protein
MAVEQIPTLQDAEAAIKAGRNSEGERMLKQILESSEGEYPHLSFFALHLLTSLSLAGERQEDTLRQRELALTRLGQLYRDTK